MGRFNRDIVIIFLAFGIYIPNRGNEQAKKYENFDKLIFEEPYYPECL